MKPILTLPCKNKHSEMEKLEKGFHCKSCDHVLTDFRNSTEEEIQATLQAKTGKVCGIFNNNQFDYKVSHIQVPAFRAVGLSLLGILGFLGPVVTSCESNHAATEQKQNAFNLLKFPMHVKGSVKDEKTGKPLPYFKVEVLQHGKVIKTIKTNKYGDFDIIIQKDDLNQEVFKLAIGGKDYKRDTLVSNITKYGKNNKVKLTIRAEAVSSVQAPGFVKPQVVEYCMPLEGIIVEPQTSGGIPEMPYIEAPREVIEAPMEPEIIDPANLPPIVSQYKGGKTRKIKEKKIRKCDRNEEDSLR